MVSKWWRSLLFVLFISSFLKSFGINICPTREITPFSGYITSPNYPNKYDTDINFNLTIRAPSGFSFRFTFTKLDLDYLMYKGKCFDYVKISGILSKEFCNENTPYIFNPGGNVVTIQMYSDSVDVFRLRDGFRLQFVWNLAGLGINICPTREITLSSGYITSPNYPNKYYNNIDCTLTIRAPSGFSFLFTFTKLDLDAKYNGQCYYDYVKISGVLSRRFCNKITPFDFNPGGNVVTVQMFLYSSSTRDGIRLQFVTYLSRSTPTTTLIYKDAQGCSFQNGLGTTDCPWRNNDFDGYAYDDFDWTVDSALTNLYQGKYAYLDASSQRKRDKAWLVSDYFNSSITCFRFSYYIDDKSGGLLKVYQQILGSAKRLLWTAAPQRRVSKWFEVNMTIPHTGVNSAYRIIVEGIKGNPGYHIAVDEFTFMSTVLYNEETSDDFDWSIGSGISRNSNTGPSTDSKGSIYGKYFFIETSQKQGDKAWLVSRSFFNSRKCLTFYYHMYGNNIGSLNVYRKIYGNKYKFWSKSGNQGNSWFKAQVNVVNSLKYSYEIIIEGVRGSGTTGVIAIDNIELKNGYCNFQSTTNFYSVTTVPSSNKASSTGYIAIVLGTCGGIVLILLINLFIICYIRQRIRQRNSSNTTTQPSRIRNRLYSTTQRESVQITTDSTTQPNNIQNPTYSTTQPESVQITTYSSTQPESVQNKNYSTNQQNILTSLPPPSYESVCN
ncbi:uncharacterized protein LOC124449412 [Xenia sp. Carnegie-2017]|uniref:uncharacterized protein LOC124449412 n=1 Tax=Xenia sp. Carnegie-2017 TaxID=2897299 RepID=UPI001F0340C7|nr:uncharacterized protein LOC124449412 [Xenia sp. Carnegie-2017]